MPTYNERGNLEPMVERLRGLGLPNLSLLVVDDNSPDGTGGVADELALRYPDFMRVIHRPGKLGLGTAYVRGFLWALERNIDLVVTMDADFSHPPEALKTLLTLAQEYDVVTGSRFAKGSSLDKRWGAIRRLLSWGGQHLCPADHWGAGGGRHGWLPLLPARGAGGYRPRLGAEQRLRLPGGDGVPQPLPRLQHHGISHPLWGANAGEVQDVVTSRGGGVLAGAGAPVAD